jgi:hypothetical protein
VELAELVVLVSALVQVALTGRLAQMVVLEQ